MSHICVGRISAPTDAYKTNWSPVCVNSYDRPLLDIAGQKRNHGVAIVPSAGRGFITDGSDASVTVFDLKSFSVFDLKSFSVLGKIKTAEDSDGVIYDPASGKVLVVGGDSA